MSMLVTLLLFSFQAQRFYEYYAEGLEKLEEGSYQQAITQLEQAIKLEPASSLNKKTYGVQLIRYLPYHNLTYASLIVGDESSAREYLRLARQYGEDQDESVLFKLALYDVFLRQGEKDMSSEAPNIDFSGIQELISVGNYDDAMQLIESLQQEHPDDETLLSFRKLVEEYNRVIQEDRAVSNEIDKTRDYALEQARRHEARGEMESAYFYYQLVDDVLAPGHEEAREFLQRYETTLQEGDDEAQVQRLEQRLQELQKSNQALVEAVEQQESDKRDLDRRIREANRQAELARQLKPKVEPSVDIDCYLERIGSQYDFNANIKSNVSLILAKLFVNEELIKQWNLRGRKFFTTPTLSNLDLREGSNKIVMRITDYQNQVHEKPIQRRISKRPNPFASIILQSAVFGLSFMMLLTYVIYQRRQRMAFRERFNPYIAGAPVLSDSMFYGRRSLLKQILNTLHNNSLMVCGERRIGKTTFLHRLNAVLPEIEDDEYSFIPVFVDLQGITESDFFSHLDQEIHAVLESRGIESPPPAEDLDARAFTQRLRRTIQSLRESCDKSPKLVLLLDEVDVMNRFSERTNQQLRSVFMKGFARHLVAVMAGINISKRWRSEGSPWYNFFEQVQLKPFSQIQARTLVTDPVKGVYSYSKEAVDEILTLTAGKPYLVQKMCVNLIAYILSENRRRITVDDVRYVHQEIQGEFAEAGP